MQKIDQETAAQLTEGDIVTHYVESEGWAKVKEIIRKNIEQIDSISGLPSGLTVEEAGQQMLLRLAIIDFAADLVEEVEGLADQHRQQASVSGIIMEDQIVRTYSSPT